MSPRRTLVPSLGLSLAASAVAYLAMQGSAEHVVVDPVVRAFTPLFVGVILFGTLQVSVAQAVGQIGSIALNTLSSASLQIFSLAIISLAGLVPGQLAWAVALSWLLSQAVGDLLGWTALIRSLRGSSDPALQSNIERLKGFLTFGIRALGSQVATAANSRLDIFIVGTTISPSLAGVYSVASTAAQLLGMVPGAVAQALVPNMGASDHTAVSNVLAKMIRSTIAVNCIVAFAVAAFATAVASLLGEGYEALPLMTWVMIPGTVLYSAIPLGTCYYWNHKGRSSIVTWIVGLCAALDIALLMMFRSRLGTLAPALASTIGFGVAGLSMIGALSRSTGLPVEEFVDIRRGFSTVTEAIGAWREGMSVAGVVDAAAGRPVETQCEES